MRLSTFKEVCSALESIGARFCPKRRSTGAICPDPRGDFDTRPGPLIYNVKV